MSWRYVLTRLGTFALVVFTAITINFLVPRLAPGDPVNVECDMLAKHLERLLEARGGVHSSRLTIEELKAQGF